MNSLIEAEYEWLIARGAESDDFAGIGVVPQIPADDLGEKVDNIVGMFLYDDVALDIRPESESALYRTYFSTNHDGLYSIRGQRPQVIGMNEGSEIRAEVRHRMRMLDDARTLHAEVEDEGQPDQRISVHLKRAGQHLTDPRFEGHLSQALGLMYGWGRTNDRDDIADGASDLMDELEA